MTSVADIEPNEFDSSDTPVLPTDHTEFPEHSHRHYYLIALALALITGLEVLISYVHVGWLFMPVLLTLMVIKFVTVVMEFMHLRHDNKIFHYLFWSGLLLAVFVYLAYLATFQFFATP